MKAILTISMIFVHAIQMLPYFRNETKSAIIKECFDSLSMIIDITTFPSFLFCFGYVFYLAYLKDYENSKLKLLKNGVNTLIVYYISAFGIFLIDYRSIEIENILDILLFNRIISYSEFLLSFSFISFLTVFTGKIILKITLNYKNLIIISIFLLLLSLFIPYSKIPIQLGIFIGSTKFSCFPIFLYFPYFLFGIYLAKNNIRFNKYVFIITFLLSLTSIIYIIFNNAIPERFPPSFFWLNLSFLYTYCLYLLCIKISKYDLGIFFKRVGENTLLYLLTSNLILRYFMHYKPFNVGWTGILIITFFIILITNHLIKIIRK